jgi:DNA adenine methylase
MGIFFSLNFTKFKDVDFIYNDINHLNYNLFNQLKSNIDFISEIKDIKVDKNYYSDVLSKLNDGDELQKAIQWLIILTCSSINKIGQNSWLGDNEFEIFKLKFRAYKPFIDKINKIHNWDYKRVFTEYDSESTFFYIDPPYMDKEDYYINHNFNRESHLELSDILKSISGRFVLSYWYFDDLENLYRKFKIEKKRTLMGTEYLIKNY